LHQVDAAAAVGLAHAVIRQQRSILSDISCFFFFFFFTSPLNYMA
jgi:hypothetical protein